MSFYTFPHSVVAADTEASPHKEPMKLTAGIIHQVDILFQDGCDHLCNVQIFQGGFQIWPSNRGESIKGNATAVSFRDFFEVDPGESALHAKIWGDGTDLAEVIIQIGLLPKRVIQPLSFEELLSAAAGME